MGELIPEHDLQVFDDALLINDFTRIRQWAGELSIPGTDRLVRVVSHLAGEFNEEGLGRVLRTIRGVE
jgi:hypothetical protein